MEGILFVVCEDLSLSHEVSYTHVIFQLAWGAETFIALPDLRLSWGYMFIHGPVLFSLFKTRYERERETLFGFILTWIFGVKNSLNI